MLLNVDHDVKIARRPTANASLAIAMNASAGAVSRCQPGSLALIRLRFSSPAFAAHTSRQGFSTIVAHARRRGQVCETWKNPRELITCPRPQMRTVDRARPRLSATCRDIVAGVELADSRFAFQRRRPLPRA